MIDDAVQQLADGLTAQYDDPAQWDRALIETEFLQKFLISIPAVTDPAIVKDRADLVRAAQEAGRKAFQAKLDYLRDTGRRVGIDNLPDQALAQITIGVIFGQMLIWFWARFGSILKSWVRKALGLTNNDGGDGSRTT